MEAPLALYRRYRPETFAEVIGQDHVTAPLRNALSNNRVNHAYLFSGPRGCGKTTSARILARAINCEKGPIAEPCGVCKSCTDLARGGPGSIDVIEIDAASHGGVDDARDLRERAFFAPVESRYKIYIIDEAHMVTTQGFNALLKLVEEPPPHLKFIFATTEPDKVIGTIRSRTHHYPFRLVPPKVLADYMATLCVSEGVAIEPAALPLVVRAGAGSVRDSLSVLDQLIGGAGPEGVTYALAVALLGFTPDSLLDACVDGFAAHDSAAVFETVEKVIETGQDPKRFAEDLLRRLRDLVVLSAVPTAVTSGLIEAAEDQGERLQTQAAGIGPAELTRAADIVAAGLLEMRGATAPRLQLELICAKVLLPGADDSTNGIQARLDRIERRLTIGVPGTAEVAGGAAGTTGYAQPDVSGAGAATSRAAARAAATTGTRPAPGPADTAAGGTAASGAGQADIPGSAAHGSGPGGPGAGGSVGDVPAGGTQPQARPEARQGEAAAGGGSVDGASAGGAVAASAEGELGGPASGGGPGDAESGSASAGGPAVGVDGPSGASGPSSAGGVASTGVGSGQAAVGGAAGARTGAWGDEPSAPAAQSVPAGQAGVSGQGAPGGQAGSGGQGGDGGVAGEVAGAGLGPARAGASGAGPSGGGPSGSGAGAVGLADIRRLWPEVLEAVKAKRRFAWIMLSQNAQVIAIDEQTLTLGLVNAGARESFARSGSDEILRQAMIDTIGVNRRVEAVVDPSTDPGAGGTPTGRPGPQSGGPQAGGPQAGGPGGGPGGAAPSGPTGVDGSVAGAAGAGGLGTGAGEPGAGAGTGTAAGGPGLGGSAGFGAGGSAVDDASGAGPGGGGSAGAGGSADGSLGGGGAPGGTGPGVAGSVDGGAGSGGAGVPGAGGLGAGAASAGAAVALQEPPDSEHDVPPEDPWEDGPIGSPGQQAAREAAQRGGGRRAGQESSQGGEPSGQSGQQGGRGGQSAGVDRREQAASKRRAAEAAVAAEQARQAAAAASAVPDVPLTPEEEADAIGEDDVVLEEDSRSHTDLLMETLGAQIITEEPN